MRHLLTIESSGVRALVLVNGLPVRMLAPGRGDGAVEVPINEFLRQGENSVEVLLHVNPDAGSAREAWATDLPDDAYAGAGSLRLQAVTEPEPGAPTTELLALAWAGEVAGEPHGETGTFQATLQEPLGWYQVDGALSLPADAPAVLAALESLAGLIAAGEVKEFVLQGIEKYLDVAYAYGLPDTYAAEATANGIGTFLEKPGRALAPLQDVRLFACGPDGQFVAPYVDDWTPALRLIAADGSAEMAFPLVFGRLDGAVAIVH